MQKYYMNKEKIKLYGEIGMGGELLLASDKEKDFMAPFFSGSIVPLGIWFGSDKFFGTTEITFGSEGSFLTLGCLIAFVNFITLLFCPQKIELLKGDYSALW